MKKVIPLVAGLFIFSFDRISKWAVMKSFAEAQSLAVWPGIFHITRVNNTGAAFGILKNSTPLLAVISIGCLAALLVMIVRSRSLNAGVMAWVLVAAGAAGNLYDRIFYGYVVDFLDFRVWPVFNIADSSICVGVLFITICLFKTSKVS